MMVHVPSKFESISLIEYLFLGYLGYNNSTAPKTIVAYLYWFFCWVCTFIGIHYIVQVFSMGSWENSMIALGSYYHAGHIAIFLIYGLLTLLPKPRSKAKIDKKAE